MGRADRCDAAHARPNKRPKTGHDSETDTAADGRPGSRAPPRTGADPSRTDAAESGRPGSHIPPRACALTHTYPEHVLLLSIFDGVATSSAALSQLGRRRAAWAWETDEDCIRISKAHFPNTRHMGEFPLGCCDAVAEQLDQTDPHRALPILICAGPRSWDFTRIKQNPLGHRGPKGKKFDQLTEFVNQASTLFNRKVFYLIENVVMDKEAARRFTEALRFGPILADAADVSCVSRPRL